MKNQNNYICKIATIEEIEKRWNDLTPKNNNLLYENAKNEYINEAKKGTRIVYIGILDNKIICDTTAIIKEEGILHEALKNDGLITNDRAFLCAFRTTKEYENQGYFSKLYKFMENDLKNRGIKELSLSVEASEERNISIYEHFNYTNYIRTEIKTTDDYQVYIFNYFYKII